MGGTFIYRSPWLLTTPSENVPVSATFNTPLLSQHRLTEYCCTVVLSSRCICASVPFSTFDPPTPSSVFDPIDKDIPHISSTSMQILHSSSSLPNERDDRSAVPVTFNP